MRVAQFIEEAEELIVQIGALEDAMRITQDLGERPEDRIAAVRFPTLNAARVEIGGDEPPIEGDLIAAVIARSVFEGGKDPQAGEWFRAEPHESIEFVMERGRACAIGLRPVRGLIEPE